MVQKQQQYWNAAKTSRDADQLFKHGIGDGRVDEELRQRLFKQMTKALGDSKKEEKELKSFIENANKEKQKAVQVLKDSLNGLKEREVERCGLVTEAANKLVLYDQLQLASH